MDLKRLPYLPIQYFYFEFAKPHRAVFLGLLFLIALSAIGFGLSVSYPYVFSHEIESVSEVVPQSAQLGEIRANYRTYDLDFPVFLQKVSFSAGPILPELSLFQVFMGFQLLLWAFVLVLSTHIKSYAAYVGFLLYALFFHFTGGVRLLFPAGGAVGWGMEFGLILLILGLAYLFQSDILRWGIGWRLLLFGGIHAVLYVIALSQADPLYTYEILTSLYFYELFLAGAFILFVSKDLNNLILLIGTNRPDKSQRWSFPLILAGLLLMIVISFLWVNELFGLGLLGGMSLSIRPTHALALVAFFTVFTSQNQFHQVKSWLSSQIVYSGLLLTWAGISLSFFGVNVWIGDQLFVYTLDHFIAMSFLTVGVFHAFFVLFNHIRLLRQKINLYYLLTQGREFGFMAVWLLSLGGIVVLQGTQRWKTSFLVVQTYTLQLGDQAWLAGDIPMAKKAYQLAIEQAKSSVKGNYNMGALVVSTSDKPWNAIPYYADATEVFEFVPARLNAAQIMELYGQNSEAEKILQQGLNRQEGQPELSNNLALIMEGKLLPDSAIQLYKAALTLNPNRASLSSNLALLYESYGRSTEAADFMQLARKSDKENLFVQSNELARVLILGGKLTPESYTGIGADYYSTYHYQLSKGNQDTLGNDLIEKVAKEGKQAEALLWDGWKKFKMDSVEVGLSRLSFLALSQPKYASQAYYLMGLHFVETDVPEIAKDYFLKSEESGLAKAGYAAAVMDIDLGWKESARQKLSETRVKSDELFELCSKEIAILLKAYGQDLYAELEWPLVDLSFDEMMRIGIYADSMSQYITALEAFRQVIEAYPEASEPYLEMGKIYNKYQDPLALENIPFGLEKAPESTVLKVEQAQAFIYQKTLDQAEKLLVSLPEPALLSKQVMGSLKLAQGDTVAAIQTWEETLEENPLYKPSILALCKLYKASNQYDAGIELTERAISHNEFNPDYWLYYAHFSRQWGYIEDARIGASRALELIPESELAKRSKVEEEFAIELKQANPEG
ncbi:MAG: tetratricopeptide repeat protein [Bacteroidota bacterium]